MSLCANHKGKRWQSGRMNVRRRGWGGGGGGGGGGVVGEQPGEGRRREMKERRIWRTMKIKIRSIMPRADLGQVKSHMMWHNHILRNLIYFVFSKWPRSYFRELMLYKRRYFCVHFTARMNHSTIGYDHTHYNSCNNNDCKTFSNLQKFIDIGKLWGSKRVNISPEKSHPLWCTKSNTCPYSTLWTQLPLMSLTCRTSEWKIRDSFN